MGFCGIDPLGAEALWRRPEPLGPAKRLVLTGACCAGCRDEVITPGVTQ